MKKYLFPYLFLAILFLFNASTKSHAQTYCIPTYTDGCDDGDDVNTFILNGANGTEINDENTGCSSGAYDDRTDESVDMYPASSYSGEISSEYDPDNARIWIDFNDDGDFDESESVATLDEVGYDNFDFSISLPFTATPGTHRMRVRMVYNTEANMIDPCNEEDYGETVDYTVNIIALPPCSGIPNAGTIAGPSVICSDIDFTMSLSGFDQLSGIIVQWQSSPAGLNTWANIFGANDVSYTTNQNAATDYRAYVVCSAGGGSDTSAPLSVAMTPPNQCYCTPEFDDNEYFYISNVNFDAIDNASEADPNGYGNYTSQVANVMPGVPTTLTTDVYIDYYEASIYAFFDWNQNGVLDDPGELYPIEIGQDITGDATFSIDITPPVTALTGNTRMRILASSLYNDNGGIADPCTIDYTGEAEDYTVNVQPMPDCATVDFPSSVNANAAPSSLCVSGDVALSINQAMPPASGITYQWQSSTTEIGTYGNIGTAGSSSNYTYNTGNSYWYHCLILCNGGTVLTSAPVFVEAVVPEEPEVSEGNHCGPGAVTLTGTVGSGDIYWYASEAGGSPLHTGDTFITPSLSTTTTYYAAAGASAPVDAVIGSGGTASTGVNAASPFYYDYYDGHKHQYLIPASELIAAGYHEGFLTALGIDVVTPEPEAVFDDFTISLGTTTATTLTSWVSTDFEEVFNNDAYAPVFGINPFTFSQQYYWNGVDNLVIQTCYYDENFEADDVAVKRDNVSGYSPTRHGEAYAPACDYPSYSGTSNSRPQFYLTELGCISDFVPVNANIRDTPIVDLGPDESLCSDANASITLDAGNPGATYLWSDGSANQTLTVNQSGTYYVTVTNEYGCVSSDTTHKDILIAPDVNLGPNDTSICNGVMLTLDAGNDGTSYYWNTGAITQQIQVDATGEYSVTVVNDLGCSITDTINVTVNGDLPTIDAIVVDNVGPYTFNFSAYNPQGAITTYLWDFGDGTTSAELSPTHTYQQVGNYGVTLTLNTADCGLLHYFSSIHILGIDDIKVDENELNLYPNPAKDNITISNKGNLKMQEIIITNALGQVVKQENVSNTKKIEIDLSGYASGMYAVRIKTDKGFVVRRFEVLK